MSVELIAIGMAGIIGVYLLYQRERAGRQAAEQMLEFSKKMEQLNKLKEDTENAKTKFNKALDDYRALNKQDKP
jgi:hypothetical protein